MNVDIKRYWKLAIAEQVTVGPDTSWSDIVAWLGPDVPVETPTSEGSWPRVHGLVVRPGCHITKYPHGRVSVVQPEVGVVPPLEAGWTEVHDDPSTTGSAVVSTLFALTGAWVPDGPVHTLSVLVNEPDNEPTPEEADAAIDAIANVADVSRGPAPDKDEPWRFEFARRGAERLSPGEAIGQALGAASMCWEHPERAGIFQSERAEQIGVALATELGLHDEEVEGDTRAVALNYEWLYEEERLRSGRLRAAIFGIVETL